MTGITDDTVSVWWQASGQGEPLLLINGLSSPSSMWFRLLPHLEADYRVLRFDNRGTGRTGVPPGPYLASAMATDAATVLAEAGESSAHVLGISMGGLIAQELAVVAPELVRSLILVATHPGQSLAVSSAEASSAVANTVGQPLAAMYAAIRPFTYAASTPLERIEEDEAMRAATPTSPEGYANQLLGMADFDRADELAALRVPTLVLHGAEDLLIPVENARRLADAIPGSSLVILPGASHQVFTDQEEAAAAEVRGFLERVEAGRVR